MVVPSDDPPSLSQSTPHAGPSRGDSPPPPPGARRAAGGAAAVGLARCGRGADAVLAGSAGRADPTREAAPAVDDPSRHDPAVWKCHRRRLAYRAILTARITL